MGRASQGKGNHRCQWQRAIAEAREAERKADLHRDDAAHQDAPALAPALAGKIQGATGRPRPHTAKEDPHDRDGNSGSSSERKGNDETA
jgi:hypothetical protein